MFDLRKLWITTGLVAALVLPTARAVVAHQTRPAPTKSYAVRPGDTLWGIAEREGLGGDRRAVVDRILDLNPGLSPDLRPGQAIELPRI